MQTSVVAHAEVQSSAPSRPKSLPTVPVLLLKLVLACLLPALLGAGLMIYMEYVRGHTQQQASIEISVQDKLIALDAQLAKAELFAQTLAISGSLNRQDLATFRQRTLQLLRESNLKHSVILYDASGQQLLNTNMPYGSPLPKRQDMGQIQSVFATGRMLGSTVIKRTSDGHAMVGILVPVFSGQKVVYALAVGFAPQNLNNLLERHHLQDEALMAILDGTGTIASRSHQPEKFIGLKGHPQLRKQLETQSQGTFDIATSLGFPLKATYSRSAVSGWTVVIAVPSRFISTPLTHNLFVLCLGGVGLLFLSLGSAWIVGQRISKSLRALRATALALGDGTLSEIPEGALSETQELSQALQASARSLRHRTQELLVANENLQARSAELTEAQHIAKVGNWKWHVSTGAFSASDELLSLYGRKILIPFHAKKGTMFPEAAWEELKSAAKATLQSKTGFSLLLPTLTADSTQIWSRVNGEPVCNVSGEVTGLRGTLQDVDVYRKAELASQDNAWRLSLALTSADLGLWDLRISSGELFFDARWAALQGYTLDEMPSPNNNFMQNVYPDAIHAIKQKMEDHFQGTADKYDVVYPVRHKNGQSIWLQCIGRVIERDAADNPVRMLGVTFDLTERKHNEAKMAHLQAEMHDMLAWQVAQHTVAALAHEVNQPLASVSILCEAASRTLQSEGLSEEAKGERNQKLIKILNSISSETERAGAVLRNLMLSVTRPDISRVLVSVSELVNESIQTAMEEGVFGCTIHSDYATDLPAVNANRLQIIKVLLNLIHNAAQAMEGAQIPNGQIWISTALAVDGCEICVSVRDEGPGIKDALQQEVFQPFITTKPHGLGMGLAISRTLIEAHGGKLWHSQDDGLGATLHFTLPISS